MSRSGYTDDIEDQWRHIMWRGRVASSIKGKRGQAMLRELLAALDAMPDKRLFAGSFQQTDGAFCTLGVLGAARGTKMDDLGDAEDGCDERLVAERFGVAAPLVQEIMYLNDEWLEDWEWEDVELFGPPTKHWPDFGRPLNRSIRVPRKGVAERRWQLMRNWVAEQIKQEGKA
jgi:hypothetical protein